MIKIDKENEKSDSNIPPPVHKVEGDSLNAGITGNQGVLAKKRHGLGV